MNMGKWLKSTTSDAVFWTIVLFPLALFIAICLAPFYCIGVIKK